MLDAAPITTILPVVDLERAKDFYGRKLGLPPQGLNADGQFLYRGAGGATLALHARPAPTRADHTAISFEVQGLETLIRALQERGVVFDDYDLPGLKTVDHVCVLGAHKAAWFHDSEGNILCLHESAA